MTRNFLITSTYILANIVSFIIVLMIYQNTDMTSDQANLWSMILMGFLGSAMMIGFFIKYVKGQVKDFLKRKGRIIMLGILGFFLVYVISIIANILIYDVFGYVDEADNQEAIIAMFNGLSQFELIMLVISIAVLTPIVEEFTFRKGVYGLIGQFVFYVYRVFGNGDYQSSKDLQNTKIHTIASIFAIIGSGLIFGLLHVFSTGDYIFLLSYGGAGIGLGMIYHFSGRNLMASTITHIIQNTLGVIVILAL